MLHFWEEVPQKTLFFFLEELNIRYDFFVSLLRYSSLNTQRHFIKNLYHAFGYDVLIEGIVVNVACNVLLQICRQSCSLTEFKHSVELDLQVVGLQVNLIDNRLEISNCVRVESEATNHPNNR